MYVTQVACASRSLPPLQLFNRWQQVCKTASQHSTHHISAYRAGSDIQYSYWTLSASVHSLLHIHSQQELKEIHKNLSRATYETPSPLSLIRESKKEERKKRRKDIRKDFSRNALYEAHTTHNIHAMHMYMYLRGYFRANSTQCRITVLVEV